MNSLYLFFLYEDEKVTKDIRQNVTMDHSAKAYKIFSRIKGYEEVKTMLKSLKRFAKDEVAQERLRIIEFYDRYGEQTTKEAFGVDRKTVWVWKKRLRDSRNSISALIPDTTGRYPLN